MSEENFRAVFVRQLAHYMQINGKNQTDLMNDLHLSSSTVSSWCTGKKLPRMDKIQRLADYFGIEKSDLLEDHSGQSKQPYYLTDAEKRLLELHQRLNAYGRKLLLARAEELVQLGYTEEIPFRSRMVAEAAPDKDAADQTP